MSTIFKKLVAANMVQRKGVKNAESVVLEAEQDLIFISVCFSLFDKHFSTDSIVKRLHFS